jgi:hypothetical protein
MGFGKFGYMAPEQLIRGGVVDHRTDIYAAGVVLYELLTGQRLYEAGAEPDYRALARKVAKGEHPMPSQTDLALAPYDNLVARALRPKVEDRYQTAAELRDAIQQCLVAVNPTISTDQLGAHMRELFADEMVAQRELHDRIANAHLEDFKEEFHTQNISTVSFALANGSELLPGAPPPPAHAPAATPPPSQAPSVVLAPDVALADGTGLSVLEPPPRKRRAWIAVLALAAAAVIAVVVVLATRGGDDGAHAVAQRDDKGITFEPIVEDAAAAVPAVVIDAAVVDAAPPDAEPEIEIDVPDPKHPKRHKPDTTKPPQVKPELTRAEVGAKFSATSRQYEAFKAKNGMRLDAEWNELTSFIQFKMTNDNLEDAVRRIDAFRAKLRE